MDYFSQQNASSPADGADSPAEPRTPMSPGAMAPLEAVMTRQAAVNQLDSSTRSTAASQPIFLRRLPSASGFQGRDEGSDTTNEPSGTGSRRRSTSAPQKPSPVAPSPAGLRRQATASYDLPTLVEERSDSAAPQPSALVPARAGRVRAASNAARSIISGRSHRSSNASQPLELRRNYESDVVDILDVIDPEVSTLNTLNNVQNSLFVPYLGRYFDRRQTYDLSRHSSDSAGEAQANLDAEMPTKPDLPTAAEEANVGEEAEPEEKAVELQALSHSHTLSSVLSGMSNGHNYAVLPHGTLLEGWSEEDKAALNDHVRHLLHSRRAKFKRRMRAFGKFVRKPMGFLITLWAFLLTFWGAAWVLFLIGWIYVGDRQAYFVEICDQILTALFCIVGIGLAPFRTVDTYHMIYIVHYHFLTWRLRREQALPQLQDPNDLPAAQNGTDLELARGKSLENAVLTPEQQAKLIHHQTKFSKSHTFYKPHETFTHRAFSVYLLMTVVILLDCHSLFQMALGGTTWGIYYLDRPKALTAVILSCSITCNISAGITISIGDRRSRKKEVVEQIFRQHLTEEAMRKLERERGLVTANKTQLAGTEGVGDVSHAMK